MITRRSVILAMTRELPRIRTAASVIPTNLTKAPEPDPWHEAELLNGWENFGAPYAEAQYRKDSSGFVHMRGLVNGDPATGEVIFNLPDGYRPEHELTLPTLWADQAVGEAFEMTIQTDGDVIVFWAGSATYPWVTLGEHVWRAA